MNPTEEIKIACESFLEDRIDLIDLKILIDQALKKERSG